MAEEQADAWDGSATSTSEKEENQGLDGCFFAGALQDGPAEGEMDDAELERFWSEVAAQEDQYVRDDQQRQQRPRELLDNFPRAALKRQGPEEPEQELAKRLRADFSSTVMLAVSARDLPPHKRLRTEDMLGASGKSNEWLTRNEARSLRKLLDLDLPITSGR